MMLKAIIAIIGLSLLCRWALGQWPWAFLRTASIRAKALQRARALLGVAPGAGREDIIAAHRRLTAMVHPDKGGTTAAMQEANAARDLLLADQTGATSAPSDDEPPHSSRD
jgi:hypothetical protein